jgi:hypothetical protein
MMPVSHLIKIRERLWRRPSYWFPMPSVPLSVPSGSGSSTGHHKGRKQQRTADQPCEQQRKIISDGELTTMRMAEH